MKKTKINKLNISKTMIASLHNKKLNKIIGGNDNDTTRPTNEYGDASSVIDYTINGSFTLQGETVIVCH